MTLFSWNAARVCEALGFPPATWERAYTGVGTDTRTLGDGQLFVALTGERYDGHDFLGDARLAGVGAVVVRPGTPRWPGFDWYELEDTLEAYGRLARYRRERFAGPVVAITGTNGKTSTKELTAAALAPKFAVHKSARNLNNLVGVPQTVLAAPVEAQAMVVECGASVRGEIARMRAIVRPDVAVVTNVEAGHLEGFGSRDAVLDEKVALLAEAPTAVVGMRPERLATEARRVARRVTTAGAGAADWTAEDVALGPDGLATFRVRGVAVRLPIPGRHMVDNALIALAVADALGVPLQDAAAALPGAVLPGGRMELFASGGMTVVHDCYNANPASVSAALDLLGDIRGDRRVVLVLGTMRELGGESDALHREAAERALAIRPDVVAAVGAFVPAFAALGPAAAAVVQARGAEAPDVADTLRTLLRPGDLVLLKASRGVALERLIPVLWPTRTTDEAH